MSSRSCVGRRTCVIKFRGFVLPSSCPELARAPAGRVWDGVGERVPPMDALRRSRPPAACTEDWPGFVDTLQLVRGNSAGWPAELDLVCRWYAPHLERRHEDAKAREADL